MIQLGQRLIRKGVQIGSRGFSTAQRIGGKIMPVVNTGVTMFNKSVQALEQAKKLKSILER
jgi:hypothetical protein